MHRTKYLILGAGPAGLSLANRLQQAGETSFLVLEREAEPGGLCRSMIVDGAPLDIGGGHFLDVRRPAVNEFLFSFLPEDEWNAFERDSRIDLGWATVHHPLEANLFELPVPDQVRYLLSVAAAGCNTGAPQPSAFVDWIRWKLGDRITEDYMLPYNRKMFGNALQTLGTYWLEKLPSVSFEETLRSCLEKKPFGTQPGHAQFYYPKRYGYGEVWLRMGRALGGRLVVNAQAAALDLDARAVTDQNGRTYAADTIVTTVPWRSFAHIGGLTPELAAAIPNLLHTSVETQYFPRRMDIDAHWVYCPDPALPYHRILVRHNFCPGSRGYWTETNAERVADTDCAFRYRCDYNYPLNTAGKPAVMDALLRHCAARGVYGLGRWGEHEHYNSDLTVEKAIRLAQELLER